MASTTFTKEEFNAREQVLSADLNRLQALASREAQDVLKNASRVDGFADSGLPRTGGSGPGLPIDRAETLGAIAGTVGSYAVSVTAGQAYHWQAAPTADDSEYAVVRWAQTDFTITPAASPKICVVVATPAMALSDSTSRNILVDPVARTVAPANVYKTNSPTAVLSVIEGTPASQPVAPAIPGTAVPLWEIVTMPADTDSSTYRFAPRIWRRVESFGSCHGLLEGCVAGDTGIHVDAGSAVPFLAGGKVHRAIIDGEVVCAPLPAGFGSIAAEPDTNANPLTAVIDVDKDVFCYLYVCGGRHAPQSGFPWTNPLGGPGSSQAFVPLRLVASLTAPLFGRAGANLAINGVTVPKAGTCYAGIWAIAKNSHNYKSCYLDGDWVCARATSDYVAGFNDVAVTGATSGNITLHAPVASTVADLVLYGFDNAGSPTPIVCASGGGTPGLAVFREALTSGVQKIVRAPRIPIGDGSFSYASANATTTLQLTASAYNMNVPRIGR